MPVYGGVLMPANIKPLKMCINITIPSVEDTGLSLYEAMCTLAGKLQDTINEINEILGEVVVTVNGKAGPNVELKGSDISVSATDDQSIAGVLSQKLAYTGKEFTSWDSVRNQPCGVYRTSGFLPWSSSVSDNGLLYIIGDSLNSVAYIFIRNSVPDSLYFAIGTDASPSNWFFVSGNQISG